MDGDQRMVEHVVQHGRSSLFRPGALAAGGAGATGTLATEDHEFTRVIEVEFRGNR
jgi:hypothetical protein